MKNNILCMIFFIAFTIATLMCECSDVMASNSDESVEIKSKSAVVLEGSTGVVLYEKEKDEKLNPASITKIMTLLLIYEDLEAGKIKLTDKVRVSEHAASMGGSQVFLEPEEIQPVETMIKCISIASANDAAVAMAEHLAGSEEAFVARMNKRAKQLGMNNTSFINCCGLDVEGHYSTAYDVAIMSKQLICNYPHITKYTTTWMDSFVHKTRKGEKEFGLTNTNKLVRTYPGITGLKTGSTSLAKYCLSATAKKKGIDIISVVMGAPEHKLRYSEAAKLLDYGFSKVNLYEHKIKNKMFGYVKVKGGNPSSINGYMDGNYKYIKVEGNKSKLSYKVKLKALTAPVKKDQVIGKVQYYSNGKLIGSKNVYAKEVSLKVSYIDEVYNIIKNIFVLK